VSDELLVVVQGLPPERQEQLLKLARAMAESLDPATRVESVSEKRSPLVERDGFLVVRAELDGPFIDHRAILEEYLDRLIGPTE
jgi:hypothetical protein